MYGIFILAIIIQLGYTLYFFLRIPPAQADRSPETPAKPVSITICARDEAQNLKKNLPHIFAQDYQTNDSRANFEVIVVNDSSSDNTQEVLKELKKQHSNLRYLTITPEEKAGKAGKKYALNKAVENAAFDWLLLTDADCVPASGNWLDLMVSPLAQGKDIVVGFGGYNKGGSLLNSFIQWETMHTFLQYSTYTMAGKPYMGVGRNLACTRSAFQRAQGSAVWNKLPSGDDDLLVRAVGNHKNTTVVVDSSAFTYSAPKETWSEWIVQKQRHLSTGKYYKWDVKLLLGGYATSHAVVWIGFFLLLFSPVWKSVLMIMALRCLIYWVIWGVTARKLKVENIAFLFPIFDLAWMIYNFAFMPYIGWKNKKQWK